MSCLHYRNAELFIEDVSLKTVAAHFGTPCYIYSRALIESNWRAFDNTLGDFPHRICYAVKANSNIAILQLFVKLHSGFDIVSLGELKRVIAAGGNPKKIIFSGVGKRNDEIEQALQYGIHCFNVESASELERLQIIGQRLNKIIPISLRVNPNVNPHTHEHISTGLRDNKFGIDIHDIIPLCQKIKSTSSLQLMGIACHIGSQVTTLEPFLLAMDQLSSIYTQLEKLNIAVDHINVGGGLGITYRHEQPPKVKDYIQALKNKFSDVAIEVIVEPGRAIIGNAGILLTKIEYLKHSEHKNFAIVDAGMNDLLRPALYNAWQTILAVTLRDGEKKSYDIAGPICESADFLGKNRELVIQQNDLLAIDSAGAYGFSMSSNYNSRCRPAEVLIDRDKIHLIRPRETLAELFSSEILPV